MVRKISGARRPAGQDAFRLGDNSPFLENFLSDAEEFWNSNSEGSLNSGNWIEKDPKGNATPLEASAYSLDGKRILLLKNLSDTFAQQQAWFQTARDSLLAHEKLHKEIQKKEILLHCIVHDLTQPLSAMTGVFHLLEREALPSGLKKYVKDGERESQRQELMIRGILDAFSSDLAAQQSNDISCPAAPRICLPAPNKRSKNFPPHFTSAVSDFALIITRTHPLTGTSWATQRGLIASSAICWKMRCVTHPRIPQSRSDLKYKMDSYWRSWTIKARDCLRARLADQLFALFSKGKEHAGKAGLGLYFCKITVERWGGAIGAETRDPGGSRFWFRLPRAAYKQKARQLRVQPKKHRTGNIRAEKERSKNRCVSSSRTMPQVNRELVIELLRKRGHHAEEAWLTAATFSTRSITTTLTFCCWTKKCRA